MTVTVANTANTNTFDYWRNRTNELATAMSTKAVTTDSNTATGNAAITGRFIANTVSVGNATVNVVITSSNTVQQSNGQFFLNANGSWSLISAPTYTLSTTTSGNTAQQIDSYELSVYGTVEYLINVKDNNANNHLSTKILTLATGATGTVFSTEYATINSNNGLGSFSANSNTTHVLLWYTPTSTNTSVNILRLNV